MRKNGLSKRMLSLLMIMTITLSNAGATAFAQENSQESTENNLVAETVSEEVSNAVSQVVLTVGTDETEVNVTWYTSGEGTNRLQYAEAGADYVTGVMPDDYEQVKAQSTETGAYEGYRSNSVTLTGLKKGTTYVYRVSGKNDAGETEWSEIYEYTVQSTETGYEFLVVGDPQIGSSNTETDSDNWAETMKNAVSEYPQVSFLLSVGDQINSARNNDTKAESNFTGFLSEEAGLSSLPIATSVGNHDNSHSGLYTSHFTLPNVSEYGGTSSDVTGEEDYCFTYGNTLFMMLNTNNSSIAEHKAFIEKAISENEDCTWKVVAFHQSIYSVASHVNDGNIADLRVGLSPVFAANDIDVVLMGHDHVYARSYIMGGVTGMEADVTENVESEIVNPDGVQYITFNSGSGSKFYNITQELYEYTAVQNQEKVPNYSHVTVNENSFTVTTYRTTDNSVVDTVTIYKTDDTEDVLTDTVKIVGETKTEAADPEVEGYENGEAQLSITKTAGYDSGVENADGGSAEIVQYNSDNGMYYVVNGTTGTLDIVPREVYEENGATGVKCDIKAELAELRPDFEYGDMTSVAVNTEADLIAMAVQAEGTADEGLIVLMNYDNEVVSVIGAGVQPDMVTFTADGSKVLCANEGEPRDGYAAEDEESSEGSMQPGFPGMGPGGPQTQQGAVDPEGTITIADLSAGINNITTKETTFEAYDTEEARAALVEAGVIIKTDTNPSVDFEPEYIAVSNDGKTAYVTLQEANAVATVDIETATVTAVNSLGFKDHNLEENALDLTDDGIVNLETEDVYGIYMPDAISTYEVNGKTYVVTANEGDSREWGEEDSEEYHCNEAKTKDITGKKVTIFDSSEYDGLDSNKTYIFGGRSFAIYEMNADGTMSQVYESGSDFEKIISEIDELAPYFNCSNDDEELDSRSGKKGPEAESVTVGEIDGKTYAFIGLERIGGIMVYDITDPENPEYVNYINSRSFGTDEDLIDGDNSPEGLVFIPADESLSGNAELIAAFEVSGTAGIFELTAAADTDEPADSDEPSDTDEPADSDEPADTDESADSAEDETPADTEIDAESDVQADAQEDVQEDAQETDEAPVKTGDAQNILNWIAVMAVSVLGAVILKFRKAV